MFVNIRKNIFYIFLFCNALLLVGCPDEDRVNVLPNTFPIANAGADQSAIEETTVTLNGTKSIDPDGRIVGYQWQQVGSATQLSITDADTSIAKVSIPKVNQDQQYTFRLTVTDNRGGTSSDDAVINVTRKTNALPTANAGDNLNAIENGQISLDGSKSSDSDGSIVSYNWKEVPQPGIAPLIIDDEDTDSPTVNIPPISSSRSHVFRLTVTDNEGGSATDDVVVSVRKQPGITVSKVSGNTASLLSQATFSVRLNSAPEFDVTVDVSSSDPSEGTPDQAKLTFTSGNYNKEQFVNVTGRNANVQSGTQDYQINFAVSSSDPLYGDFPTDPVKMEGIALHVDDLSIVSPFFDGRKGVATPEITYTGSRQLTYGLTQNPTTMLIDTAIGTITWTPTSNDVGNVDITLTVTDGVLSAQKDFTLEVFTATSVQTTTDNNELTVTDPTTNLKGLVISATGNTRSASSPQIRAIADSSIAVVDETIAPEETGMMTKLSDVFFAVASDNSGRLRLTYEITSLPTGVEPEDVHLYTYVKPAGFEEFIWSPVSINKTIATSSEGKAVISVDLEEMDGVFVWGYHITSPALPSPSPSSVNSRRDFPEIATCNPVGEETSGDYVCSSILVQNVKVFIDNFGTGVRWGTVTPDLFASWILGGFEAVKPFGITTPAEIYVKIEPISSGLIAYVNNDKAEEGQVVHVTDDNNHTIDEMQVGLVNALGYASIYQLTDTVLSNIGVMDPAAVVDWDDPNLAWLANAIVLWLEDKVLPENNTYRDKVTPIERLLENGLLGPHANTGSAVGLIKMIDSKCPNGFNNIGAIFTAIVNDFLAQENMRRILETALKTAQCDFGSIFGDRDQDRASILSGLALYQVATQQLDDMSKLDPNDTKQEGDFVGSPYVFLQGEQTFPTTIEQWLAREDKSAFTLNGIESIPLLGAYSFHIPRIEGDIPAGYVATLNINSQRGKPLGIVYTSQDSEFSSSTTVADVPAKGAISLFGGQYRYIYDFDGKLPHHFFSLFNFNSQLADISSITFNIIPGIWFTNLSDFNVVTDDTLNLEGKVAVEGASKVTITAVDDDGNTQSVDATLDQDTGGFTASLTLPALGEYEVSAEAFDADDDSITKVTVSVNLVAPN